MCCQCPLQPPALPDPASRQQPVRMCRTPACKVGHARRPLWMHSEAGLPLTPFPLQAVAWPACCRVCSSCWCRFCRRRDSSRRCWRASPATPSPTSTSSHTASCRWVRPCTSCCSVHKPQPAMVLRTFPFLGAAPQCHCSLGCLVLPQIPKRSAGHLLALAAPCRECLWHKSL